MGVESDKEAGTLRIAGEATIFEVAPLKDALVAAAGERADWQVDLTALTGLDSSGLQLLVAFRRAAPSARLEGLPDSMRERAERLGLARHLF